MNSIDKDFASLLELSCDPPCLSLYQPTHRRFPEAKQDPIRYRNLVDKLEASLKKEHDDSTVTRLLEPFRKLENDKDFWIHGQEGLAVFGGDGEFRTMKFQRSLPEIAVVADSFHIKPLLRIAQSADRYHVLALSRKEIKFFEGNRDALDEIEPEGVPMTLTDALGEELTEPHQTVAAYGGAGPGQNNPMFHGHGGKSPEEEKDTERFFRAVDRAIAERYSKPTELPLIVATLPEHRSVFNEISHNPRLIKTGPDVHPDALTTEELRERVWEVLEPMYVERLEDLKEKFGSARANGQGHDDPAVVSRALIEGKVATLLVEAEKHVAGTIDRETGTINRDELDDPEVDDLLDDFAELTLKMGGEVVVVPSERMPTDSGIAAIYRY